MSRAVLGSVCLVSLLTALCYYPILLSLVVQTYSHSPAALRPRPLPAHRAHPTQALKSQPVLNSHPSHTLHPNPPPTHHPHMTPVVSKIPPTSTPVESLTVTHNVPSSSDLHPHGPSHIPAVLGSSQRPNLLTTSAQSPHPTTSSSDGTSRSSQGRPPSPTPAREGPLDAPADTPPRAEPLSLVLPEGAESVWTTGLDWQLFCKILSGQYLCNFFPFREDERRCLGQKVSEYAHGCPVSNTFTFNGHPAPAIDPVCFCDRVTLEVKLVGGVSSLASSTVPSMHDASNAKQAFRATPRASPGPTTPAHCAQAPLPGSTPCLVTHDGTRRSSDVEMLSEPLKICTLKNRRTVWCSGRTNPRGLLKPWTSLGVTVTFTHRVHVQLQR